MEAVEQVVDKTVLDTDKTPKELMVEKLLSSEEVEHKQPIGSQQIQVVSPRTITGHLNNVNITNRGAIAWFVYKIINIALVDILCHKFDSVD